MKAYEVQIDPDVHGSDEDIIEGYFFKREDAVDFVIAEYEKLGVDVANQRKKFPNRLEIRHVAPASKGGRARVIDSYIGTIHIK